MPAATSCTFSGQLNLQVASPLATTASSCSRELRSPLASSHARARVHSEARLLPQKGSPAGLRCLLHPRTPSLASLLAAALHCLEELMSLLQPSYHVLPRSIDGCLLLRCQMILNLPSFLMGSK